VKYILCGQFIPFQYVCVCGHTLANDETLLNYPGLSLPRNMCIRVYFVKTYVVNLHVIIALYISQKGPVVDVCSIRPHEDWRFFPVVQWILARASVVGALMVRSSIHGTSKRVYLLQNAQTCPGSLPASHCRVSFPDLKDAGLKMTTYLHVRICRVCEWVELYLCSPYVPSWHVQGLLYH
jgi:hypothetical protein